MKTIQQAISLVMAVVMFFTACPVQATRYNTAKVDTNGLQEKVSKQVRAANQSYSGMPDADTIRARYLQARENAPIMLAEIDKKFEGQDTAALEEYVAQLKAEAKELSKTADYEDIPYVERQQAAFNTLLFINIGKSDKKAIDYVGEIGFGECVMAGVVELLSVIFYEIGDAKLARFLHKTCRALIGIAFTLMIVYYGMAIIEAFTKSYTPAIAPSATEDEAIRLFADKPFQYLKDWEKKNGAVEQALMYRKGPKAAQVLADAVDIEFYTSRGMTVQDVKDIAYMGSRFWYDVPTEKKVEFLNTFAERLRAQDKAQKAAYVDNNTIVHRYRAQER